MESTITTIAALEAALIAGEPIDIKENSVLLWSVALCGENAAAKDAAQKMLIASGVEWD